MSVLGFIKSSGKTKMGAVDYYRTFLPLKHVNKNGLSAKCVSNEEMMLRPDDDWLVGHDVYTMSRIYSDDFADDFVRFIHSSGGKVVLDADDDLTETYRPVSGHGDSFKQFLGLADYVTCSTPPLARFLGQYTKRPPVVLRNHIDAKWFQRTAAKARKITPSLAIGFSGSPTHWGDWYLPAIPWLQMADRNQDVALTYHGDMQNYIEAVASRHMVYKLDRVPYSEYPKVLRQFDILLCPIDVRDEFNAGKSAIKAIEAMSLGVIPICSNFTAYRELKEAGAPIVLLKENTREAWYEAMVNLVDSRDIRDTLSAKGPKWVKENRDIRVGYKLWTEFYREVIDNPISVFS